MKRSGITGKRFILGTLLSFLLATSASADYKLILTDETGVQTEQCIKSYSFSNNLESLAKQKGVVNDVYSETEVVTNKMYKGKPVYRKIANISASSENRKSLNTGIDLSFMEKIIKYEDITINKSPNYEFISLYNQFWRNSNTQTLWYYHDSSDGHNGIEVTIEYTKITDSVSTNNNEFKSYLHYVPSNTELGSLVSIDMKDVGVRFLEDYTYDSTTDSCNKN